MKYVIKNKVCDEIETNGKRHVSVDKSYHVVADNYRLRTNEDYISKEELYNMMDKRFVDVIIHDSHRH